MQKNNSFEFNANKAVEEATEFNMELVKYQTKHPDNEKRPTREDILKEFGDLNYRGLIALLALFPELTVDEVSDKIDAHIISKLLKLIEYRKANKYKGGL